MATDSSHRVIMRSMLYILYIAMISLVSTLAPSFLIGSSSFLQVRRTTIISGKSLKFGTIRPHTVELAALERLKKFPKTYNWENLVSTLEPLCLIGSSSFLQVTRTTIKNLVEFEFRRNSTTALGVSCP